MKALLEQWGTVLFMGLPAMCYLLQASLVYYEQGRYGMAFAVFSYAQANLGFMLDSRGI